MNTARAVHFLIVDDQEANLMVLEALLRREGLELLRARSGAEALELLMVHEIALAFLDVQMPSMDGFELAELMRGTERTRRVPIIFVTAGNSSEQRCFRGYELGAVDFLFKPIDPLTLASKAKVFFELARQRIELEIVAKDNARLLQERTEGEERLRSLFQNNIDGIFSIEGSGRFIDANPVALKISGYSLAELQGRTFADLCAPGMFEKTSAALFRAAREEVLPIEIEIVRKDGQLRDVILHGATVLVHGELQGSYGVVVDITERKRVAAELEEVRAQAEAASKAKDHFLATLSHELRTPLTPVLMALELLEHDPRLPADARADLTMMRRNVRLETRLIDDLLDLTRITQGKLILHEQLLEIHSLISHTVQMCLDEAANPKHLRLELDLAATETTIWGDGARMAQVFWNLLHNAVKFTPEGGCISVRTCNPAPGTLAVSVIDTGIGIPPEVLPEIFRAFEQGGSQVTRQFGGLGLGLPICRKLTELHGGRITPSSAGPNKGAEFRIELPILCANDPRMGDSRPADSLAPSTRPGAPGGRILLVEDDEPTAQIMRRLLVRRGHAVEHAASIKGALALASHQSFDLVISDLGLPDGSGTDLMRELRRLHGLRGIALSGYGMDEDLERSRQAGFEEHLVKPVDFHQLQERIALLLLLIGRPA